MGGVTLQSSSPLILISLCREKDDLNRNLEGRPDSSLILSFILCFISRKQKTVGSEVVSLALTHLGQALHTQTGD